MLNNSTLPNMIRSEFQSTIPPHEIIPKAFPCCSPPTINFWEDAISETSYVIIPTNKQHS